MSRPPEVATSWSRGRQARPRATWTTCTRASAPNLPPARVSVLRVDEPNIGNHAAVLCRVEAAEAVWLAGGDQSDYLVRWPSELQAEIASPHTRALGGTSAGAMVLGAVAFDAANGSVTSSEALLDPDAPAISLRSSAFVQPELSGVLVDTHFSARAREGRLIAFLANAADASGDLDLIGVGLDERTALVMEDGRARVLADDGGSVWVYRLTAAGSATGGPLTDAYAERVRLRDAEELPWPMDWATRPADTLMVVDGLVNGI